MPKPTKATFKSYVGSPDVPGDEAVPEPDLLPGELVIALGSQALRFIPFSELKQGLLGNLVVTNFKISFRSLEQVDDDSSGDGIQRNKLIGSDDIVLNNIDAVYQVSKGKKKRLIPGMASTTYVKYLEIHCRDFQIHQFSLKATPKDEAKRLVNAIVHHSMPLRHDLLFAFEFQGNAEPDERIPQMPRFNSHWDWEAEITRLQAKGFRVADINTSFLQSESLPEAFVVPSSMTNTDVLTAIQNFTNYRCPTWSYSHHNGASLIRMAVLLPNSEKSELETEVIKAVQTSHPSQKEPKVYNIHQLVPGIKEIQTSYEKLRGICMPGSLKEVETSDVTWYSSLSSTNWLQTIGSYLNVALRIVDLMNTKRCSVIIKEQDCRDLSPVVTCLVQLLLDPHTRTIQGFQSLVEREWVALGHRFRDRLGLVFGEDSKRSPVFLLFLDCVWQLLQQFPSAFQFSEMYLTSLWDSFCFGLFDNFLFNCIRERELARNETRVAYGSPSTSKLMSVWDWSKQFSEEAISLFNNPLYRARSELDLNSNRTSNGPADKPPSYSMKLSGLSSYNAAIKPTVLRPVISHPLLKFWSHCYLRWLTPVQILSGGTPSEYLQQCVLVEEIICLRHKIKSLELSTPFTKAARPKSRLIFETADNPSNKLSWSGNVTSSFPYTPRRNPSQLSYFETPITVYLENSFIGDDISLASCDFETSQSDTDL